MDAGARWPGSDQLGGGEGPGNFYFRFVPFLALRRNEMQEPALMHH